MSCSYSTLEDAWETPRDRFRSSRKERRNQHYEDISPSPSLSPGYRTDTTGSDGGNTIVIGSNGNDTDTDEGYESPGDRSVLISKPGALPRPMSENIVIGNVPISFGGRGSPVSMLDEDDYVSDSGESAMVSRSASPVVSITRDMPGLPSGTIHPHPRPLRAQGLPGSPGTREVGKGEVAGSSEKKIMRHILRIRDDVREMLRSQGPAGSQTVSEFPFIETGLFITVGLFVLLAMQMMVNLRSSSGLQDVASGAIENIKRLTSRSARSVR